MFLKRWLQGAFWIGLYVVLAVLPLVIILMGPNPPGRGFLSEFSSGLGFVGLAMLSLQFALTARFRSVAAPYGIDMILHFHRAISLVAAGLIFAHPLLLVLSDPSTLHLFNPIVAPWPARWGMMALLSLGAILVISLGRMQLGIRYEVWRTAHAALAVVAVLAGLMHVSGINHYLALPWKRALWTAFAVATVGLLVYVRLIRPLWLWRTPYRVAQVKAERGNSWTLVLEPMGHGGMHFEPGQFAWLRLGRSPFAIDDHPFSFSSSATHPEAPQLTIKSLGDFTRTVRHVQPGTIAYLDGPYGAFSLDRHPHAAGFVMIAGGVGITPIMSMLRTAADRQDSRPYLLLFANKNWEGITFREELEQLTQRLHLQVVHILSQAPPDWQGETGFITPDLLARHLPENRRQLQYFLCGPPPMMAAVERTLLDSGVPLDFIEMERFNLV